MKHALLFLMVATAVLCTGADEKLMEQTEKAKALVDALAKDDFTAAGKDFDTAMKKALPTDKLEATWKTVLKQVGAFQKRTVVRAQKGEKYDLVFVTCQFEKMELDVKVVFNADKEVTGFFFVPQYEFKTPPYAKLDSIVERKVTVGDGEWALPGTLSVPKGDGPFPGIVLVQGSGPHDRDETIGPNKPLRDLAWGLASQGVAVLRYEKRTKEHGPKFVEKLKDRYTPDDEVTDDALAAVAELRKHKEIDGKKVFVLGHSLGAHLAPRVGEKDDKLAGLVILAGNSRPLEDLIVEQLSYIYSLKSEQTDEDKALLEKLTKQVAKVKDPKLALDTPKAELPLDVPASYWLALRAYDAAATAAKLKMPLFVMQGERDYQVTMTDFEGWQKALGSRKDVRLKSYPKLNHLFMEGEGKAKPEEYAKASHVAKEVVDDIAKWIKD
jgi:dienelactone hydrolase